MTSINATRAKWCAIGAAAALAVMRGWFWWTSGAEHEHVYGRWKIGEPAMSQGTAWPVNNRFCIRCGWRDWRLVDQDHK
jgi:hypothetical protein